MPSVRFRARTFRRVYVTTPTGENKISYRRRKNGAPQCAKCGAILPGVARGTKNIVRKLPKSSRRPERPYGGVLCSKCSRKTIIANIKA